MDDEILHENKVFGFFQFLQQHGKVFLAGRKIDGPGVGVDREPAVILQIADLSGVDGVNRTRRAGAGKKLIPGVFMDLQDLPAQSPGGDLAVEDQVEKTSEYGDQQDQKNPDQLVSAFLRPGDRMQSHQKTDRPKEIVYVDGIAAGVQDEKEDQGDLKEQDQQHDETPEQQRFEGMDFHGGPPVTGISII